MRCTSILLALPSLALAQDQKPLADKVRGWFNKAQSYIPTAAPSIPNPAAAAGAKVAERVVHTLTLENWKSVLQPSAQSKPSEPEEWMVYITGRNKTCYGLCDRADDAWKEALPFLAVRRDGPQLASLDCDDEQVLCNAWAVGPPSVYVMLLPHVLPDQSKPHTTVHNVPLNRTSVTAGDIGDIHAKQAYKQQPAYEGYFHPFDGVMATSGLAVPLAYVMWAMSKMPSWLPMIVVSLSTRMFMGRRTAARQAPPARQGQAAPAQ